MTNPPGGDRADVKVPEDLRELYDDCIADDSGCSRTTTSGFMAQLIERIAKLEAANKSLLARAEAAEAAVARLSAPINRSVVRSLMDFDRMKYPTIIETMNKIIAERAIEPLPQGREVSESADARQKGTEQ